MKKTSTLSSHSVMQSKRDSLGDEPGHDAAGIRTVSRR